MDTSPPIAVFCYNFPHRKTHEFLLRLYVEGFNVQLVLATDKVKLNIPKASIRTKLREGGLIEPRNLCEKFGWNFHVVKHNSDEARALVEEKAIQLGVIAGARILKERIIQPFELGIINFHPGILPQIRGLDSMLWSILQDVPLGVSSHVINEDIDAGNILLRHEIKVHADDTIYDLSKRLLDAQLDMLAPSIQLAMQSDFLDVVDAETTDYYSKMKPELESQALVLLPNYLQKHASE